MGIAHSLKRFLSICFTFVFAVQIHAHEIVFCGEKIPIDKDFIATKLMDVIRRQIPNVNLPQLRKRAEANFPIVEYYLRATGLPVDFKYLAIVESGFQNLSSPVGARGFWQFMEATARDNGLVVNQYIDERDNIYKSTYAACKLLASYYKKIQKDFGISSWVLTAAAYNIGIGRISQNIRRQGNDYFSMNLNEETATYVYKIIAVKELFEYPELYMKDFGYNVFAQVRHDAPQAAMSSEGFKSIVVNVSANDGKHPASLDVQELNESTVRMNAGTKTTDERRYKYIAAVVTGKYKKFKDGELVSIQLLEDMIAGATFNRGGTVMKGTGWIINERIFIDLGYGDHSVVLSDASGEKGLPVSDLENGAAVVLKLLIQKE